MSTTKKYLDSDGVRALWLKVKDKVAKEETRAKAAEAANATAITNLDAYVGDIPADRTETNIVAFINAKAQEVLDSASGGSSESAASVKNQLDTYKGENDTRVGNLETRVDGAEDDIDALEAKVTTLIGTDANKSVRTIANEELVKQLVPDAAQESLDTLTEIANWIQEHPEDVAEINSKIVALETKTELGLDDNGTEYATVKDYVTATINALDLSDYAKATELALLAGRVTTLETKVTNIENAGYQTADNVNTLIQTKITSLNLDGKYDALGSADAALASAKTYVDESCLTEDEVKALIDAADI